MVATINLFNQAIASFFQRAQDGYDSPQAFYDSKDRADFVRDQVVQLSDPLNMQGRDEELFGFLDILFRASAQAYTNAKADNELPADGVFTWKDVDIDFSDMAQPSHFTLLTEMGLDFTLYDVSHMLSSLKDAAKKVAFDKPAWFKALGDVLDYADNKNLSHEDYNIAYNPAYPESYESDELKAEVMDLFIEKGVAITPAHITEYIYREPELIGHLTKKHPQVFPAKEELVPTALYALQELISKYQPRVHSGDVLDEKARYKRDVSQIKRSFEYLKTIGVDMEDNEVIKLSKFLDTVLEHVFVVRDRVEKSEELTVDENIAVVNHLETIREDLGYADAA